MNYSCGRSEMCKPCIELPKQDRSTVCESVGVVACQPYMKTPTSVKAVSNALDQQLDFWVDDDDYVTKEMRQGALRSAVEVLKQREQRPTSEDLMTTMLTEAQVNE